MKKDNDPDAPSGIFEALALDPTRLGEVPASLFRLMIQDSLLGFYIIDETGFRYANRRLAEILGRNVEEILGTDPEEPAHPEDRHRVRQAIEACLRGETDMERYLFRVVRPDGTEVWVETQGVRTTWEGTPVVVGTLINVTEQVQAENALQQREAYYRALVNTSSEITSVADRNGICRYITPSIERLLGYRQEERLGTHVLELVAPADRQTAATALARVMKEPGATWSGLIRIQHKNGQLVICEVSGSNMLDNPAVSGIVIHVRDVSALSRTEGRLAALFNGAPVGIALGSSPERLETLNPTLRQILGERSGPLNLIAALHEDDRAHTSALFDAIQRGGENFSTEVRLSPSDGATTWLRLHAGSVDEGAGDRAIFVIVEDITHERAVREALFRSEAEYRTMFTNVRDALLTYDEKGNVLFVSPSAERLFGRQQSELTVETLESLVHPDDRAIAIGQFEAVHQNGRAEVVSYRILTPRGVREVEVAVDSYRTSDGELRVLEVVRDQTERRSAEAALRTSEQRLAGIISMAADAIISVDRSQKITMFNEAAEKMFGYTEQEILGQSLDLLIPEQFRLAHQDHIGDFGQEQTTTRPMRGARGIWGKRKNGDVFPVEASITKLEISGEVVYTTVIRDISERREAEQRLLESEERYRRLVNELPDAVVMHSNGIITLANPAAARLHGVADAQELIGRSVVDFALPEDRDALRNRIAQVQATDIHPPTFLGTIVRPDGSHRLGEVQLFRIVIDGKSHVLSLVRDVTERLRNERWEEGYSKVLQKIAAGAPLRDVLLHTGTLIEAAFDGGARCVFVILDDDGSVAMQVSPSLSQQDVRTITEVTCVRVAREGRSMRTIDVTQHEEWAGARDALLRLGLHAADCRPIRSVDGNALGSMSIFFGSAESLLNADHRLLDNVAHTVGIAVERATSEAEITGAYKMVQAIVEASPAAIIALDGHGRVASWNKAAETLFGISADEIMGLPFAIMPESPREQIELLKRAQAGEVIERVEVRHRTRKGRVLQLDVTLSPLGGEHGGVLLTVEDRTEAKRNEAIRQQLREAERLAGLGEMARAVAHEVNNPLGAIMAISYGLMHDPDKKLSSEARDDVQRIEQEANRAAGIMRDLLKFTRMQSQEEHGSGRVDLNAIVDQAITSMTYSLRTSTLQTSRDLDESLPPVEGDPRHLLQVVLNLVNNAEQAMRPLGEGELIVRTRRDGREVVLEVMDTGPGIPENATEMIFEPMYTTKPEGTGLGLAVSRQLVEAHGGTLMGTNRPEGGACFIVRLPAALEEEDSDTARPAESREVMATDLAEVRKRRRRARFRILVVDDEDPIRTQLAKQLERWGFQVEQASNGVEGLHRVMEGGIDFAALDIRMPEMNGSTMWRLMSQLAPADIPYVVFMTGDALAGDTIEFLEETGQPYLTKPFSPPKLLEVFDAEIERRLKDGDLVEVVDREIARQASEQMSDERG